MARWARSGLLTQVQPGRALNGGVGGVAQFLGREGAYEDIAIDERDHLVGEADEALDVVDGGVARVLEDGDVPARGFIDGVEVLDDEDAVAPAARHGLAPDLGQGHGVGHFDWVAG
jgi:hypothetical protein